MRKKKPAAVIKCSCRASSFTAFQFFHSASASIHIHTSPLSATLKIKSFLFIYLYLHRLIFFFSCSGLTWSGQQQQMEPIHMMVSPLLAPWRVELFHSSEELTLLQAFLWHDGKKRAVWLRMNKSLFANSTGCADFCSARRAHEIQTHFGAIFGRYFYSRSFSNIALRF